YAVRATVTDQYVTVEGTFTWRITGPNVPPTLTPVPNQTNADNLVTVALQLSAVDRNGDTVTFGATGLPRSLTIDPATGRISGTLTPSDPGVYHVTVIASDGQLVARQTFIWTVTHVNRAPWVAVPENQPTRTSTVGSAYANAVLASRPEQYWRFGEAVGPIVA